MSPTQSPFKAIEEFTKLLFSGFMKLFKVSLN